MQSTEQCQNLFTQKKKQATSQMIVTHIAMQPVVSVLGLVGRQMSSGKQ